MRGCSRQLRRGRAAEKRGFPRARNLKNTSVILHSDSRRHPAAALPAFRAPYSRHSERSRGISARIDGKQGQILRLRRALRGSAQDDGKENCALVFGLAGRWRAPCGCACALLFANRACQKRSARFCPCKQAKTARFFTMTEGRFLLPDAEERPGVPRRKF